MNRARLIALSFVGAALLAACAPDFDALDPDFFPVGAGGAGGAGGSSSSSGSSGSSSSSGGDCGPALDDKNSCTTDTCQDGNEVHTPVAPGTACAQGSGTVCSAAGQCVECLDPSTCPGKDDDCNTRTCSPDGQCGVDFTPKNTAVSMQVDGDCQEIVCDGDGGTDMDNDNADVPDDGKQCTTDTCFSGKPKFTNQPSGTACNEGGGKVCNGAGACVECTAAAQCGASTACLTYTCASNTCGSMNAAVGAGCGGSSKCNGMGSCVACAAPTSMTLNAAGLPLTVPNGDPNGVVSMITAAGLPAFITDVDVNVNISADTSGDLEISLISPKGTIIDLSSGNGGATAGCFAGTKFDDDANAVRVTKAAFVSGAPLALTIPERNLGLLTGEDPNGMWSLVVKDVGAGGSSPSLAAWSLVIGAQPTNLALQPQTFSNNVAMPTVDQGQITSNLTVAGMTGEILNATVTVNLQHVWSEQLTVTLMAPGGKSVQLIGGDGGTSANVFTGTTFSDGGPLLVGCSGPGCVTFVTGVLVPAAIGEGSLSKYVGDSGNGQWSLTVADGVIGDGGMLNSWSLTLTPALCNL